MIKLTVIAISTFFISLSESLAQQTMSASGGDAVSPNGQCAYSIGQVFYAFNSSDETNISEGVEQPIDFETYIIPFTKSDLQVSAYPNPTNGNLTLSFKNHYSDLIEYTFFDEYGKLINSDRLCAPQTQIPTTNLPSGVYILHISKNNLEEVQTFKIIKN